MQVLKGLIEFVLAMDFCDMEPSPQSCRSRPGLCDIGFSIGVGAMARRPTTPAAGTSCSSNSSCFGTSEFDRKLTPVAARPVHARHKTKFHRVRTKREDNGNC